METLSTAVFKFPAKSGENGLGLSKRMRVQKVAAASFSEKGEHFQLCEDGQWPWKRSLLKTFANG